MDLGDFRSLSPRLWRFVQPRIGEDGRRRVNATSWKSKVNLFPHCLDILTLRHEISLEKLEIYLRTAVPEISLPLEVEQFTYGQVPLHLILSYNSPIQPTSSRTLP